MSAHLRPSLVSGRPARRWWPALLAAAIGLAAATPRSHATPGRPDLAAAPAVEQQVLARLLAAEPWPRRAIAAMRLERFGCAPSADQLVALARDDADWRVRAFAVATLGRRRVTATPGWLATESEPRVVRTALRHGYTIEPAALNRGVHALAGSRNLDDGLLAAELAAASDDPTLADVARVETRRVILRMDRVEAGALSPRLATLTGQPDLRRVFRWQQWLRRAGRAFVVRDGRRVPPGDTPVTPSPLAVLPTDQFAALESYIETLGTRSVDLALCIDCTASMSGELAAVQGDLDDLIAFVGAVVGELRVGLVAYRDRRDRFHTRAWDLNADLEDVRAKVWGLTAEGGGDSREAVHAALKLAYTQMTWDTAHTKVLIVVGDAPPYVGLGARCVEMAGRAARAELVTHAIEADGRPVEHFAAIAAAGGGRCVPLQDDDRLIPEIAGLTLGERYDEELRAFFATYLALCR